MFDMPTTAFLSLSHSPSFFVYVLPRTSEKIVNVMNRDLFPGKKIPYYHGTLDEYETLIRKNGIDISKSRPNTDFGQGFYLSESLEHATKRAHDMAAKVAKGEITNVSKSAKPVVLVFQISKKELNKFKGLKFESADDAWTNFVTSNRNITPPRPHGYDFVSGPVLSNPRGSIPKAFAFPEYNQTSIHTEKIIIFVQKALQ